MKRLLIVLLLAITLASACSMGPPPDTEATMQAAVAATQAALPTDTPIPAPTDTPTYTPTRTPTATATSVLCLNYRVNSMQLWKASTKHCA